MPDTIFDPAAEGWHTSTDAEFIGLVGPIWRKLEGDRLLFGLLAEERHGNRNGAVHGGMLMTLMDHAIAMNSWETTGRRRQATIQLDVQFVSAVMKGDFLIVRSEVVRATRSVNFMRGTATIGDRIAVTANGIWKMLEQPGPSAGPGA